MALTMAAGEPMAGFAAPFHPEGVVGAGRHRGVDNEVRQVAARGMQ